MIRRLVQVTLIAAAAAGIAVAEAGPTAGRVAFIEGDVLTVQHDAGAVREGDLVAISRAGRGSLGVWQVTGVGEGVVKAEPLCPTGVPVVGDLAHLLLSEPPAVAAVPVLAVSPEVETASRIELNIGLLSAPTGAERQQGAKHLYRHFRYDPEVQRAAEEALLAGYNRDLNDRHHVDAMAWLCNILGVSGEPAFAITLSQVAQGSASAKLRDYARRNLHRLS